MITLYLTTLIILIVIDYFFFENYKHTFTLKGVFSTAASILTFVVISLLFPDFLTKEQVVRLGIVNIITDILLYFVIVKWKVIKSYKGFKNE